MSVLDKMRLRAALVLAPRNAITTSKELAEAIGLRESWSTRAGVTITKDNALQIAAVYACVRAISEDIAGLPLKVYRKTEQGREEATDHWLSRLLRKPNSWQTGFEFREMVQAHIELGGNFFALKTVLGGRSSGEVAELIPTSPERWRLELDVSTAKLRYWFTWPDGRTTEVPAEKVFHLRGLTLDSYRGISPIRYQAETLGFASALAQFGSQMFGSGANIGGVLQHSSTLSDKAYTRLKSSFEEKYAGLGNSHKVLLLEEGATFTVTGMKNDEAQFLESRKYSRSEIAGIFRIPANIINDNERSTFSNVEQQTINYSKFGIVPRLNRLEARMNISLVPEREQDKLYVRHNLTALERGDFGSRVTAYQKAILSGWLNRNEVRELEDRNAGPEELNTFLTPVNMTSADKLDENTGNEEIPPAPDGPPAER